MTKIVIAFLDETILIILDIRLNVSGFTSQNFFGIMSNGLPLSVGLFGHY